MKMDQGWTVPNAKGVKIRRKMRDVSISRVIGYLFGCWFRHQQISQKSPFLSDYQRIPYIYQKDPYPIY